MQGITLVYKVDLNKWKQLSIPQRDTAQYIPFAHIDAEEYAYIISKHKQFTATDPLDLSMLIMSGELDSVEHTVVQLLQEDNKIQNQYKSSLI